MITKLAQIVTRVQTRPRKRLVVAYAEDLHTLQAVDDAVTQGIVDAILVGEESEIVRICKEAGIDAGQFKIVDQKGDVESVALAVKMIRNGEGDILMKGLVTTDKYMRGILNKESGLMPPKGVLSHVTVFELPEYHKLLCVCDVAVLPYPDLTQKIAMVGYLAQVSRNLGVETPKIAFIAPSEQLLQGVQSSTDAAILAKMGDRGQLGKVIADGPLALDVALYREVAQTKKLQSPVSGDVDGLLFPTLDAANVFFKAANQILKAPLAAMVMGTTAPCVLTSRGDSAQSKLYSIALGALSAK